MKPTHQPNSEFQVIEEVPQLLPEGTSYEWCVHPLRERPFSAVCLLGFLFLLHVGIYVLLGHWVFVLIAAPVLFLSLASFFLPVHYTLHPRYVGVQTLFRSLSRAWSEFSRYEIDKNGIFLSPFQYPTRLENYRGLYVRFGEHRDEVLQFFEPLRGNLS